VTGCTHQSAIESHVNGETVSDDIDDADDDDNGGDGGDDGDDDDDGGDDAVHFPDRGIAVRAILLRMMLRVSMAGCGS
jgi:hypothetical protein